MKLALTYICTILFCVSNGQSIQQYVDKTIKIQQTAPREIVYLQTDKPSYLLGDTMWFSAYVVDAYELKPSTLSGIAYIEFIKPSNGLIKRYAIHLALGHGFAQIPLDIKMQPGKYRIRAYTRWMENFPDSLFFQKEIPILGGVHNWFMDVSSFQQVNKDNQDSIHMSFSVKDQSGKPRSNKMITLQLTNAKGKALFTKEILTQNDGSLKINFTIANNQKKNENYALNVLDGNNVQRITFPIYTKENTADLDVQFLPESGHLVASLENTVAFKAVGQNGLGISTKGIIRNSKGDSVVAFSSTHNGMGTFTFTPQPNEKYIAYVENTTSISLPSVENSGTIIHIDNLSNKDSVRLDLLCSDDLIGQSFFILGRSKGYIPYGAKITFNSTKVHIQLEKSNFLNGVSCFSLLKTNGQQMNERSFFYYNQKPLKIDWQIDPNIHTKDSIPFSIKVLDNANKPVQGIFSIAITDNQQVLKDKNKDESILSYLLLSADLKGTIESPGYYFHDNSAETVKSLDILMLTQGFIKYDWDTTKMTIPAEPDFQVTGKATSLFGKGIKKANIVLLGTKNQTIFKDTTTDDNGRFVFKDFPIFDTSSFVVQARNKKNKSFGVGIEVDNQIFPSINNTAFRSTLPNNINIENSIQKRIYIFDPYLERKYGKNELLDVVVVSKARIEDSKNLNGPGQYDQAITKGDLEQMGDSTLLDILTSKLKIRTGSCGVKDPQLYYMLKGNKVRFVFDGVNLDFFYDPLEQQGTPYPYLNFVTQYLKYYTAKDIKGIEVMHSSKYSSSYIIQYLTADERMNYNPAKDCPYTYIEITTYGAQGPFLKQNGSIYLFRPQPFSYGTAFYQPKYINRTLKDPLPDVRSTIYWHPMIVTDQNGEAKLSFYSAGLPTQYQFWLEGLDLNGHIGFGTKNIEVKD